MEFFLTEAEQKQIKDDAIEYIESCPPAAKLHTLENLEGFIAGWLCRAAWEKNKREKQNYDCGTESS